MNSGFRDNHSSASLLAQVTAAELRILEQRRLVRVRLSMLNQGVRRRLTSPTMLLLAAGGGFIAGTLTRRRPARKQDPRNIDRPPPLSKNIWESTLKVVAVVRSFLPAMRWAEKATSPASDASADTPNQWPPEDKIFRRH